MGLPSGLETSRVVYHEGEPAELVYRVRSGLFLARIDDLLRDDPAVGFYGEGDFIGLEALSGGRYTETVTAVEDSLVESYTPAQLHHDKELLHQAITALAEHLDRHRAMNHAANMPTGYRVVRTLQVLAKQFGTQLDDGRVSLDVSCLTHELLGELTNATRSQVTKVIAKLKETNALAVYQGSRAYVVDLPALEAALDEYIYAAI